MISEKQSENTTDPGSVVRPAHSVCSRRRGIGRLGRICNPSQDCERTVNSTRPSNYIGRPWSVQKSRVRPLMRRWPRSPIPSRPRQKPQGPWRRFKRPDHRPAGSGGITRVLPVITIRRRSSKRGFQRHNLLGLWDMIHTCC